jgi:hypothetical protein
VLPLSEFYRLLPTGSVKYTHRLGLALTKNGSIDGVFLEGS